MCGRFTKNSSRNESPDLLIPCARNSNALAAQVPYGAMSVYAATIMVGHRKDALQPAQIRKQCAL
jgi:hypothetical protein